MGIQITINILCITILINNLPESNNTIYLIIHSKESKEYKKSLYIYYIMPLSKNMKKTLEN